MPFYNQAQFDIRCEWGSNAVDHLAPADVLVIVDVLSFTTSVEIAVTRGAVVFPYRWKDESAAGYARARGAELATPRSRIDGKYTLAPSSLVSVPFGLRLVLPSPNGSALSAEASKVGKIVLAGCLRNASAVAARAQQLGKRINVIPAGERWPDGSLRFSVEDLLGAGAIIEKLAGRLSPEALLASQAFAAGRRNIQDRLAECASARQLIDRGFSADVDLAGQMDVSQTVPVVREDAFMPIESG